jgi:hypothetical protein
VAVRCDGSGVGVEADGEAVADVVVTVAVGTGGVAAGRVGETGAQPASTSTIAATARRRVTIL